MDAVVSGLLVFALLFCLDFGYAFYTAAVTRDHVWSAAVTAAFIYLLTGVATLSYVHEPWLLAPAMAGAFTGTITAMRWRQVWTAIESRISRKSFSTSSRTTTSSTGCEGVT